MRLGCGGLLLGAHWLVGGRALVRGEWLTGGLSAMHALRMGGVLPLDEEAEKTPLSSCCFSLPVIAGSSPGFM